MPKSRDSPTALVAIYQSRQAKPDGLLLADSTRRAPFVNQVAKAGEEYGLKRDENLSLPGEMENVLLIIATKGQGADCVERVGSQLLVNGLRETQPNMTWPQI